MKQSIILNLRKSNNRNAKSLGEIPHYRLPQPFNRGFAMTESLPPIKFLAMT
ncbi:hypothetical protein [Helicobacter sp. UBA3407]|uniref:hypothetical protein n=1 Tax=Helicobacter sp. UBA3407 TaxID=1946588 RepID=UPI0026143264|nr:hypothetical protein [Helicobacter sp. UBA3407]